MAMERDEPTTNQDQSPFDRALQKTNRVQTEHGLPKVFYSFLENPTEETLAQIRNTTRKNGELKVKPAWVNGKNTIVLHFNKVPTNQQAKEIDATLLKAKYSDHIATYNFAQLYAAQAFVLHILKEAQCAVLTPSKKWINKNRLYLNEWILASSDDLSAHTLEEIMEYEPKGDEKKWTLPHPYDNFAKNVAYYHQTTHPQINARTRESKGQPPLTEQEREKLSLKRTHDTKQEERMRKKQTPTKETKVRESGPKKAAEGMTTLAQICALLKLDPKETRAALRTSQIKKPGASWQWDEATAKKLAPQIKSIVEKARKK